jgi:hypothetical protein
MSRLKLRAAALLIAGLGMLALPAHAKDSDWLPIPPEDLAMRDNPLSPGSAAMILYREMITNDPESYETHYFRIKVFTEAGKKWGDVEIPYLKGSFRVTDLKARTVHPDGSIVNFDGRVFDKVVVKSRQLSYLAKTFTLPDVQVGSILEYRYKVSWDLRQLNPPRWYVQHKLFTRKAHFSVKPYMGSYTFRGISLLPRSYGSMKQPDDGTIQFDAENVPGVADEAYMPPEDEVKGRILFYYTTNGEETAEQFWKREGKEWYQVVEDFIGKRKAVQQEAAAVAGSGDPPETRLRQLYARAQQVRNLSYESSKSEAEQRQQKLKDNSNVEDVLKHGYGYRSEINRLFVALARAAGSDAVVIRVAERDDNFFHFGLLDSSQLTGEVTLVRNGAQERFLDPGTPHCPFGLLTWEKTGVKGIKLMNKEGGPFVETPNPLASEALEQRKATVRLDEEGTLTGNLQITYHGQEALKRRLDAMDTDETGRRKAVEDELKALLPSTAELKLGTVSGLEASEGPVTVEATVEIPGFAASTGRRLLLPLGLFQFNNRNPVYFHFPFEERDEVDLEVPAGTQVENLPAPRQTPAPFGGYEISRDRQGNHVRLHRRLWVGGVIFQINHYPELHEFYDKVTAADGEAVVLQHVQVGAK